MSFAARLDRDISPQIDSWVQLPDISARLVHFDDSLSQGLVSDTLASGCTATVKSAGSSMAMGTLVHQSNASTHAPSLYHGGSYTDTEATPTETSVSTGLVDHFYGVPLLEDNDGVLEVPHAHRGAPFYECVFWFLRCEQVFDEKDTWETHCLSHFRGEEPPRSVQCPLCEWHSTHEDGSHAWNLRMQHLASHHVMLGQTLRTSRPDFHLFQHLWQTRLIDDHDLKELKGGNHNLTTRPGNFVETNGRRRERDGRRHRTQHVATYRRPAPPRD